MSSRMERYNYNENVPSRVSRNNELYKDIDKTEISRIKTRNNERIIESNDKNIDIEKIKKYISDLNDTPIQRKKLEPIVEEKRVVDNFDETKEYDINVILSKAKEEREVSYDKERYKKLRDTQYDILNKLKVLTEEVESPSEEEFNTEEKTLIDLINTISIKKQEETNLLDSLIDKNASEEETIKPIKEQKTKEELKDQIIRELEEKQQQKQIERTQELINLKGNENLNNIDKSFYTNSMSFSKEDFEGFDELEKNIKKKSVVTTICVIILFVVISATLFFVANYVFDLGLF